MAEYNQEDKKALFKALDTIMPDHYRVVSESLEPDMLYNYLLYSFERGELHKDHLLEMVSQMRDTRGHYDPTEDNALLIAACVGREDEDIMYIVKNEIGRYDCENFIPLLYNQDVDALVQICTSDYMKGYAPVMLVCSLIIAKDFLEEILTKLKQYVGFETIFNCCCISDNHYYHTKWDFALEIAVIRVYNPGQGSWGGSHPETVRRFRYLKANLDQV